MMVDVILLPNLVIAQCLVLLWATDSCGPGSCKSQGNTSSGKGLLCFVAETSRVEIFLGPWALAAELRKDRPVEDFGSERKLLIIEHTMVVS